MCIFPGSVTKSISKWFNPGSMGRTNESTSVGIQKYLCQGCPLSILSFILCMTGGERKLEASDLGYSNPLREHEGRLVKQRLLCFASEAPSGTV